MVFSVFPELYNHHHYLTAEHSHHPRRNLLAITSHAPFLPSPWCCCSICQLCPTLCNSVDCNILGFPVFQYLLGFSNSHLLSQWCYLTIYLPPALSSIQSLSPVRLFATPWIAARQASLSIANSRRSLKLTSIESVMPSSHLILCRPLLLLPAIPPSIRVFSNESALRMRWPKYWSFSFSIIPSKEHAGLISFRMDWLDLLVVQGTLKSLLQHHSSEASMRS